MDAVVIVVEVVVIVNDLVVIIGHSDADGDVIKSYVTLLKSSPNLAFTNTIRSLNIAYLLRRQQVRFFSLPHFFFYGASPC